MIRNLHTKPARLKLKINFTWIVSCFILFAVFRSVPAEALLYRNIQNHPNTSAKIFITGWQENVLGADNYFKHETLPLSAGNSPDKTTILCTRSLAICKLIPSDNFRFRYYPEIYNGNFQVTGKNKAPPPLLP